MATYSTEQRTVFDVKVNALYEIVAFLSILVLANLLFGSGERFVGVEPHPFWIVILLVTMQYGLKEGIVACALATLFLYVGNVPEQLLDETTFEYQFRLSILPFLWFSTAFVLGQMRMRQIQEFEQMKKEKEDAREHSLLITESYRMLKQSKEALEARLASQVRTVASIYNSIRELETLIPVQIMGSLDDIVLTALSPKKFSVFATGPNGLEVVTAHGWKDSDAYKRRHTPEELLYGQIVESKRMVCFINPEDAKVLASEGVVAAPLVDRNSQEVFGMVKIEEIDFFAMDLGNLEVFKMLCESIGSAFANATHYRQAKGNAIFSELKGVYSYNLFNVLKQLLIALSKQGNFCFSVLSIAMRHKDNSDPSQRNINMHLILDNFAKMLPPGAVVCVAKRENRGFEILLPTIDREAGHTISLKIADALIQAPELTKLVFEVKMQSLEDLRGEQRVSV